MADKPEIPADILQGTEQAYATACEALDEMVDTYRSDLQERYERTGIECDSLSFTINWVDMKLRSREFASMIATAALIKLARAPRAANDPMEHFERDMQK